MITHRSPIVQIFFKQMFEHLRHSGQSYDGKRRRQTKHYTRQFSPKSDTGRFLGDKDGNMHRAVDGLAYDRKKLRKNRAFGRFLSLSLDFVRHRFHTLWTKISDIRRIDGVIKPCYAINNEHKFEHFATGGET